MRTEDACTSSACQPDPQRQQQHGRAIQAASPRGIRHPASRTMGRAAHRHRTAAALGASAAAAGEQPAAPCAYHGGCCAVAAAAAAANLGGRSEQQRQLLPGQQQGGYQHVCMPVRSTALAHARPARCAIAVCKLQRCGDGGGGPPRRSIPDSPPREQLQRSLRRGDCAQRVHGAPVQAGRSARPTKRREPQGSGTAGERAADEGTAWAVCV
eukprot:242817-Chlamydomonas_euryale.AAC.4